MDRSGFSFGSASPPPPPAPPPTSEAKRSTLSQVVFLLLLFGCQQPQLFIAPLLILFNKLRSLSTIIFSELQTALSSGNDGDSHTRAGQQSATISRRIVLHPKLARFQARLDAAAALRNSASAPRDGAPTSAGVSEALLHAERRARASEYRVAMAEAQDARTQSRGRDDFLSML